MGRQKMINFKKEIAKSIANAIDIKENEIYGYIEIPKDTKNGDYAFPCFNLAKSLKKSLQLSKKTFFSCSFVV